MDASDVGFGVFIAVIVGLVLLAVAGLSYHAGKVSVAENCRYIDHFMVNGEAYSCHPMRPL